MERPSQTFAQLKALLARLNGVIEDARALRDDLNQKSAERRASDRGVPQPLGPHKNRPKRPR